VTPEIKAGLAFVDALDRVEQRAFLGLFAGARFPWHVQDGRLCMIGKFECEQIEDCRDFYLDRLTRAGLFWFEEMAPYPLRGLPQKDDGSYPQGVEIKCGPTELGYDVREAYWTRHNEIVDARAKEMGIE